MSNETPWPAETGDFATYPLHCHCGAIRYKITISPPLYPSSSNPTPYPITQCSCSYCTRNGILSVHPLAKNVEWVQGVEQRGEYRFGSKMCPQYYCRLCGSSLGVDVSKIVKSMGGEARIGINVRMLKDFDMDRLTIVKADMMKNMPPKYEIDWDGK